MTGLVEAWERFWFKPQETSTLAIFRVVYGFVVLAWTIALSHDAFDFFSRDGILPRQPDYPRYGEHWLWSIFGRDPSKAAIVVLFVAMIVAAVCLIVGFYTRAAAIVVFVGLISLERRNLFVFNSGDGLIKTLSFYLMLAPAGASFSIDRFRRAKDRFWEFPRRAPWALRLMQLQLSFIYISTVWAKVRGITWNNGTSVSYAVRVGDLARLHVPRAIADSELIANFLTYGTLAIELGIGILVWNRKLRPYVLALGVLLHLGIDLTLRVGFFSYAMLTLYLAFIPPETASALLLSLRSRLSRSALASRLGRAPEEAPESA